VSFGGNRGIAVAVAMVPMQRLGSRVMAELIAIAGIGSQTGNVIQFIESIVTHGGTFGEKTEPLMAGSIPVRTSLFSVAPRRCGLHRRRAISLD
jgi:hypothetical protein